MKKGRPFGYIVTQETREKLSRSLKGMKHSSVWIRNQSLSRMWYKPSKETIEKIRIANTTHGENSKNSPEYRSWAAMRNRCLNKKYWDYKNYGARGISVCSEWNNFLVFLNDMGRKPTLKYSLDRIDNNKGYSKENCRWATIYMQNRNRRNCVKFNGETATEASRRLGGCRQTIINRVRKGMNLYEAFNTPILRH